MGTGKLQEQSLREKLSAEAVFMGKVSSVGWYHATV